MILVYNKEVDPRNIIKDLNFCLILSSYIILLLCSLSVTH